MNYYIKLNSSLKRNSAIVICNPVDEEKIRSFLRYYSKYSNPLTVYDNDRNALEIEIRDILYVESIERKIFVYTMTDSYRWTGTFNDISNYLESYAFYRINRTTIVNTFHIEKTKTISDCRRMIVLSNQEKLIVNRSYKNNFSFLKVKLKQETRS